MIELEVTEKMFGPMAVAAFSPWFRPVCSRVILNEFLSDTCQPTHLLESMPSTIHHPTWYSHAFCVRGDVLNSHDLVSVKQEKDVSEDLPLVPSTASGQSEDWGIGGCFVMMLPYFPSFSCGFSCGQFGSHPLVLM